MFLGVLSPVHPFPLASIARVFKATFRRVDLGASAFTFPSGLDGQLHIRTAD